MSLDCLDESTFATLLFLITYLADHESGFYPKFPGTVLVYIWCPSVIINSALFYFQKWYKWTYIQNRNRPIYIEIKLKVTKGERGGGKIRTNKDLLYSTGNYTQYSVITYKWKESEIFFFRFFSLTQHCKLTILQ